MRDETINEIIKAHKLPRNIAEQLVDAEGNVDAAKLQIALESVIYGKSPASGQDPGLVEALSRSYWEASDKKQVATMIRLKDAIHRLGGRLLPKE